MPDPARGQGSGALKEFFYKMNLYTHMADMLVQMDQRRLAADRRIEARIEVARLLRRRKPATPDKTPRGRSGPAQPAGSGVLGY